MDHSNHWLDATRHNEEFPFKSTNHFRNISHGCWISGDRMIFDGDCVGVGLSYICTTNSSKKNHTPRDCFPHISWLTLCQQTLAEPMLSIWYGQFISSEWGVQKYISMPYSIPHLRRHLHWRCRLNEYTDIKNIWTQYYAPCSYICITQSVMTSTPCAWMMFSYCKLYNWENVSIKSETIL